jgi:DNA-binding transcriptional MerR regulator
MKDTLRGISQAAREVGCAEGTLRSNDAKIRPLRDSAGRRLYTDEHIARARKCVGPQHNEQAATP